MTEEHTKVSVIIPAYNAAWCIATAVKSVFAQTLHEYQLIVVDDGSTDATQEILSGFGERLLVLKKPNGGLSSARNIGIQKARGDYIAFLDADDYWKAEKLERQVALMEAKNGIGFCSTATRVESVDGEPMGEWICPKREGPMLKNIFETNSAISGSGSGVMVRRKILDRVGCFDESLQSLEDVDMWMRLAAITEYSCIDDPLTVVVKRGGSMSGNLDTMRAAAIRVMKKNRPLLGADAGHFWRGAYAAMLTDYAKWAYRTDRKQQALTDLLAALVLAPVKHGRLSIGLMLAMAAGRKI